MLTLKQMMQATPAAIKARARNQCYGQVYALPRSKKIRETATKSGGYIVEDESGKYREFKFRVKCTDGWRKVAIRYYGPLNVNTKVWCWCSCPYFKYHCEVVLTKHGSSAVVQSNGQRPRFTNPRGIPRVCKHVLLGFAVSMRRRELSKADKKAGAGALTRHDANVKTRETVQQAWHGDEAARPMPIR